MPTADWLCAQELIRCHGWNTTCSQLLNPGLELWFNHDRSAVVGFVVEKGVHVVAGAPVCDPSRLPEAVAEFERTAHSVCYFGAEERLYSLFRERDRAVVVLGGQPVWRGRTFVEAFERHASLRAQLHRARNKGVCVAEVREPTGALLIELDRVLTQWLATRGLPALHFLVEPKTLRVLGDRRLFVASQNGSAIGFVVLAPIPARKGHLTEQFVRGAEAPNGTVELALAVAARQVESEGSNFLTMGIVPLSQRVDAGLANNPGWLNVGLSWARAHLRRFYDFEGLDEFKAKFGPDQWDPVYVLSNEPTFKPRALHAIASAFTAGHPLRAFAGGLARAARTELRWLTSR